MSCVDRSVGQSAQGFQQVLALECGRLCQRLSLDQRRQARTGRDRGHTAARAIAHLVDPSLRELDGKAHDVAADRMLQPYLRVRRRQLTDVARMLEVIKD